MGTELDHWIDTALATYSAAEPLAGLDDRILQRVRRARTARRRIWCWALTIPTAAAIAVAIVAPKRQPAPVAHIAAPPTAVEAPPASPPAVIVTARRHPRIRRPAAEPLPKRPTFPTLTPLTWEERVLVQVAQSQPELLIGAPAHQIDIEPLEIVPISPDSRQ